MQSQPVELSEDPGHLLRVVLQKHVALMDLEHRSALTPVQYAVLLALTCSPGIDQRAVAELSSLDKSTVGDVVGRLIRLGLIRRHRDPSDGRRNVLRATREATNRVNAQAEHLRRVDRQFLAPLGPRQRTKLLRHLRAIAFADRSDPSTRLLPDLPGGFTVDEIAWAFGRLVRICLQSHTRYWAEEVGAPATAVQHAVLLALSGRDDIDQRELGELVSLDKATITHLLGRMTRRDLVRRRKAEEDGRRNLLRLTPEGARALSGVAPGAVRVRERLLAPLPAAERAWFINALRGVAFIPVR